MKPKITKMENSASAYGGIYFVIQELQKKKIPQLIDHWLGERVKQARYSYSDTLLSWMLVNLCEGTHLETIKKIKGEFEPFPECKLPSPDSVGLIFKSLAVENDLDKAGIKSKNEHYEININTRLNHLLLDLSLKLKRFVPDHPYTLDYDVTVIECKKHDARYTYTGEKGYAPAVASINKVPVYIEGRAGNVSPKHNLKVGLFRAISLLNMRGIQVNKVRCDSAAYSIDVMEFIEDNRMDFFIRAMNSRNMFESIEDQLLGRNVEWTKFELHGYTREVTSVRYAPMHSKRNYRLVVERCPRANKGEETYGIIGQGDNAYVYRCIITNNSSLSDVEVARFYHQRGGDPEKIFDYMKHDFNWSRLPFSFMNENVVFMYVTSMAYGIYRYLLELYASKVAGLKETFRLETFNWVFLKIHIEVIPDPWEIKVRGRGFALFEVLLE